MRVELDDCGLVIVPDSEFEAQWLVRNFKDSKPVKAYIKRGVSASDIEGLRIHQVESFVQP